MIDFLGIDRKNRDDTNKCGIYKRLADCRIKTTNYTNAFFMKLENSI